MCIHTYIYILEIAEVLYDFDAELSDELTLRVGNLITDCVPYEKGWMIGELNGKRGMFPCSFVKIISTLSMQLHVFMCVRLIYIYIYMW